MIYKAGRFFDGASSPNSRGVIEVKPRGHGANVGSMPGALLTRSRAATVLLPILVAPLLASCTAPPAPRPPAPPATAPAPAPATTLAPFTGYDDPVEAGNIESGDVQESSGLAASACQDVLWTHNDSGGEAVIFALDTEGGNLGTWQIPGAQVVDWEAIATYKDSSGKCFLIIGDVGDNDAARGALTVYRVAEPVMSAEAAQSDSENPLQTESAQVMQFRYPDGNSNAETLLVRPQSGELYVVTKKETGPAGVYRIAPEFGTGSTVTGEKLADMSVAANPEGRFTDGSMSPDGRRVILCDVEGGYELVLPDGETDPDAVWRQEPAAVDLGDREQGEGVTYSRDGLSLYASSEGEEPPLYLIKRK